MTGSIDASAPGSHSFAVLAYGESPYVEECIRSLGAQSIKSRIFLATSTPSAFLRALSVRHGIPLVVNGLREGIAADWSFAYDACATKYVTLAHQDDVYAPDYAEQCLAAAGRNPDALIVFTDSAERAGGRDRLSSRNLAVKRCILRFFFAGRHAVRNRRVKNRMLSLGNPIACPSVLFHKERIGTFEFARELLYNLDWDAWYRLARREGAFVYLKRPLMTHRIHPDSALVKGTVDQSRRKEDIMLFERFWPKSLAAVLATLYRESYHAGPKGGTP